MNRFSHQGASHYLYLVGNTLLSLLTCLVWSSGRRHYLLTHTIQQIYFTALQSFKLALFIGLALGLLVVLPFSSLSFTDLHMLTMLMQKVLFHQLVPFITAVVVIGRSGTSITAEIASMQSQQAIDGLLIVGVDPHQLLVLPRLLGVTFSMLLLAIWMMAGAILGSGVLVWLVDGVSLSQVWRASAAPITLGELAMAALMMTWFGVSIATIHAYYGFLSRNAVETSRNLPRAFVRSFLTCLLVIVLFSWVRYG